MSYSFNIPVGTTGNTFSATVDTDTYYCDGESYLIQPKIYFRYNCTYTGYSGPDPCYVNSDTVASLTPSSYGKVGLSIPQIQSHGIKAYSQPNDYTNSCALFTTVEYANSWGGDPRTQNTAEIPYAGFNWTYSQITGISQWTISTNIPIFATDTELQSYLSTGTGIKNAVNYKPSKEFRYPVTTGAGGSGTVIISMTPYSCDGSTYKTTPKVYFRYKAHSIYGYYMISQCDVASGTAGQSTWDYRVAFSVQTALSNGDFRGNNDPYSLGTALLTQNREGQAQDSYSAVTLTTTNNNQQVPWNVLGWNDFRVDRMDECIFSTNAPIFTTTAERDAYIRYGTGVENAINYKPIYPVSPEDKFTSAQLNLLRRRLIRFAKGAFDYSPYFNYTIADGYAWITSVKRDKWLQDFGNLDIYVPNELEGYPTVVVAQQWD